MPQFTGSLPSIRLPTVRHGRNTERIESYDARSTVCEYKDVVFKAMKLYQRTALILYQSPESSKRKCIIYNCAYTLRYAERKF